MRFLIFFFILASHSSLLAQLSEKEIVEARSKHEAELRDTSNHMLDSVALLHFAGLDYFDFDSSYQVVGTFQKKKGKRFKMPTSTDRLPVYRRYGFVTFQIDSVTHTLTVYQNMSLRKVPEFKDYLFLPFRDATSAKSTYGGGRYLDAEIPKGTRIILDFNQAYNPYCAYSHHYSCPIPPPENTLKGAIIAGEKIPLTH